MSTEPLTLAQRRAAIGRASRGGDPRELIKARREYAADKLADYIERTVAAAPPLTAAQRDRLALLLKGGGPDAA